ncbi:MAG TPA: hypothetical protein VM598_12565 [Bdellovibrionota bacterium]|nr:hypothetical protein [Bdellovibrionota bacterium]
MKKPFRGRKILLFVAANILIALLLLKGVDSIFGTFVLPSTEKARALAEFRRKDPFYLDRFPGTGSEGNWPPNRYLSWAVWTYEDQTNPHVNIVGGFRPSHEPSCAGTARNKTAWFFGGSTMLGLGSPEDFTIPSLTCKELQARDPKTCWRCKNFGMEAYVSSQELVLFYRLLKEADLGRRDRPDLAVFYDGVNELHAAVEGTPLEHLYFAPVAEMMQDPEEAPLRYWLKGLSGWIVDRVTGFFGGNILEFARAGRSEPPLSAERIASHLEVLAKQYAFNYRLMSELASAEGIDVLFFLQPSLFDKKPLSEYERWNLGHGDLRGLKFEGELGTLWSRFAATVGQQRFKATRDSRFLSLRDSFVGASQSVFHLPNDWNHMNWHGNTLIARRIAGQILTIR